MPTGHYKQLTKKQEGKIRKEYLEKPFKRLARELGISDGRVKRLLKKWGLKVPKKLRDQRLKSMQYSKGSTPMTKGKKQAEYMSKEGIARSSVTRFKPGHVPDNIKYNGHERFGKGGYILMRVDVNNYVHKHVYLWEKVNGKVPEGHCLNCIDGNRTNCDPGNWMLVTRQEHMLKNSIHDIPKEIIPSMVLQGKIAKKIKNLQDAK